MIKHLRSGLFAGIFMALTACSSDPSIGMRVVDAAATPDGATPDGATPDGATPDNAPPPPDDVPLPPPPPDDVPTDGGPARTGGPCHFSFDCEGDLAGPVCFVPSGEIEGRCVECIPDTLCDDGVTVCNRSGRCSTTCTTNSDCAGSATGSLCNTATHACVRCITRADCSGSSSYCNTADNRCDFGCGADADCAGRSSFGRSTPRCNRGSVISSCEECVTDAHCGAGQRCSLNRCVAGCTTSATCAAGQTCCSGACVDTATNPSSCGACGTRCTSPAGTTPTCVASTCGVGACVMGRADCDRTASNGCEVETATNATNCGSCGNACPARANATPTCAAGACGFTCAAGFGDCNRNPADGCEVDMRTDGANCGRCGGACAMGLTCAASTCSLVCAAPLVGCGMTCVDTRSNTAHCGGCGRACLPGQMCTAGACTGTPTCAAPLIACGMACVNPQTSTSDCGSCGNVCPARPNATATCAAGRCGVTCAANFADCDGDATNGCEVDLRSSAAHCGACARACTATNGTASCTASACVTTCNAGYFLMGGVCVLSNPCAASNGGCNTNATCTPGMPGMRSCACNSGYVGDGMSCMPESTCSPACATGQTCVNRICVGDGQLRVSMVWDVAGDMDLHVVTPAGREIYYGARTQDGGRLDRDDTTGTGPENIFWTAAPPAGVYLVCVVPYRVPRATSYTVTINRPGVPAVRFTGSRSASTGNAACSRTSAHFVGMFTL